MGYGRKVADWNWSLGKETDKGSEGVAAVVVAAGPTTGNELPACRDSI